MTTSKAKTYVIGLRRGAFSSDHADLADSLQALPDVEVIGDWAGTRVVVRTTPDGLQRLRDAFGDRYHIEEMVEHQRS